MPRRYLFGPVSAEFADQKLRRARQAGTCLAFNQAGGADLTIGLADSWDEVCRRLPPGWRPEFVVLALAYAAVPRCLWSAPVPLVALAGDWHVLWHGYRRRLRCCDLVLTDPRGVQVLAREGIPHARPANLSGCERTFVEAPWPERPRDIDVLFAGNLRPAVQRERMPWLGRLARLGRRWQVAIRTELSSDAYRELLGRARIVFNHSDRGECNGRAFDAAAAGALLFQEAGNREVPDYFRDRRECVLYTPDNLEALLTYYLEHEDERRALADAARTRVRQYTFEELWDGIVTRVEEDWPALAGRSRQRETLGGADELLARYWQTASAPRGGDPTLAEDLRAALQASGLAAPFHNALGLTVARTGPRSGAGVLEAAIGHFRRAVASHPGDALAALNLAEALAAAGQPLPAIGQARRTLKALTGRPALEAGCLDGGHFPPGFDAFRVEWERAGWANAGRPRAEARAKRDLVCWRLHALLAELTGDPVHAYESLLTRPDLPGPRATLGILLTRTGRYAEALPHLERALADNPFDNEAARALHHALGEAGYHEGQRRLARDRAVLARVAPQVVPVEPWFAGAAKPVAGREAGPAPRVGGRAAEPPAAQAVPALPAPDGPPAEPQPGRPRVSLCMIVKNEEKHLPDCLASAADLVDEVIVIDTGSADRTREVAARYGARVHDFPWIDDFAAARNESLRHATGAWVLWLDADDRLSEENRGRLRTLLDRLGTEPDAYAMKVRSGLGPAGSAARLLDQVRLFPLHPDIRWRYRVHEQILPAVRRRGGQVRWTDVVIDHVGYLDPAQRKRKLKRNLRLLQLDDAERPEDAFTLFNLGWTSLDLERTTEAIDFLRRCLKRSDPTASFVRKVYLLLTQGHRLLGRKDEALATCREGLTRCPDDPELLHEQGQLLREAGDLPGAEASFQRILEAPAESYFGSVAVGLRGSKTRHQLALVYHAQGRGKEAEAQWQAALAEHPDDAASWLGLGNLFLSQERWSDLEEAARRLAALPAPSPGCEVDAAVLRARARMAQKDHGGARRIAEEAVARFPRAVLAYIALSHALLQEGKDWDAAERTLRTILELDPGNAEARNNLAVLLRQQKRDR